MSRFQRSRPVQLLVDLIVNAQRGTFFNYQELSHQAGVDVREKQSVLQSARRILEAQHGVIVTVKRGMGIQVSTGTLAAEEVRGSVRKIYQASQKSRKKVNVAVSRYTDDMPLVDAEEMRHTARMLGAIQAGIEVNRAERKALEGNRK